MRGDILEEWEVNTSRHSVQQRETLSMASGGQVRENQKKKRFNSKAFVVSHDLQKS